MTESLLLALGRLLVFWVGIAAVSIISVYVDRALGIKVLGSSSAKIGHNILGMAEGGFIIWLMSVTIFGG